MDSITVKANIISKDLSEIVQTDIVIKQKGFNENKDVVYTYALPSYIYNALEDTSLEFQSYQKYLERKKELGANFRASETYLKKNIESILISGIIRELESYSYEILTIKQRDTLQKTKKLFIRFNGSENHDRCSWTGGYMGLKITTQFQFFIGYEVCERESMTISNSFSSEERPMVVNYYTLIKHATGSMAKWSTNFKEGTKLEPLYFTGGKKDFINSYQIIDWTQEREDYLTSLQERFCNLNENLRNYLESLDNVKLDALISNSQLLLK